MRGEAPPAAERELYFVRREGGPAYGGKDYHALVRGDWKLLQNSPYGPLELYNLRTDPSETTDAAKQHPEVVAQLTEILRAQHTASAEFPLPALDRQ